jgi:hypothetical protein
MFQYTLV